MSLDTTAYRSEEIVDALYGDGITALKGAFPVKWVDRVREDVLRAYEDATSRPNGAIGRGPNRYYVEIHPEQLSGFVELVTHPWVTTTCEAVLGPNYEIVEVGFDIPFPGAVNQPWHRDFASPKDTYERHKLTSLAFNLTTVDTTEDMGPFEIAPGTQWEDGLNFNHGMFPPKDEYARYEGLAQRKMPQRGDISVRSALTIHRGTKNFSDKIRPVLILGVDAPGASPPGRHNVFVTKGFWDSLPEQVQQHMPCTVVDQLKPVVQGHTIEGLVMGAVDD